MPTKRCARCKTLKDVSEFNKCKSNPDGLAYPCRLCAKEAVKRCSDKYPDRVRERGRKYRAAHPEIYREASKKYNDLHPEEVKKHRAARYQANRLENIAQSKAYQAEHPEQVIERGKIYYAANKEKIAARKKTYRQANKENIAAYDKQRRIDNADQYAGYRAARRALKRNAPGDGVTLKQWNKIKEDYSYLCAYCGQKKRLGMDHVAPLSKGGRHDIDNVAPSCRSCNSSKNDTSLLMFMYQK